MQQITDISIRFSVNGGNLTMKLAPPNPPRKGGLKKFIESLPNKGRFRGDWLLLTNKVGKRPAERFSPLKQVVV
jgi:hypothetical protein